MQDRDAIYRRRRGRSANMRMARDGVVRAAFALWLGCAATASACAKEPAEEFVAGLRGRGLYELTLDYLSQMESSSLADEAFKQRIAYLRGVTLIDEARQATDSEAQSKLLDRARGELDRFAAANPASAAGAEAQTQLATVLVEQAKRLADLANELPAGAAYNEQRDKQRVGARQLLDQAQPMFQSAAAFYTAAIEKLPKTPDAKASDATTAGDSGDSRQDLRGRLAQVSVLAAQSQFEQAATYSSDTKKFRVLNEAAAKDLSALFDKYSKWLVGFYARMYEGRCYQALGDFQRAEGCFEEIISQSSVTPAFRKLIASAYGCRTECFIAQKKYDEAIAGAKAWLGDAHGVEAQEPEWLALRFHLAEGLQQKSEAAGTSGAERRKLLVEAREAYRLVANSPGEFQRQARAAGAALGKGEEPRKDQPRDFKGAYEAGKEAMASVNAATMALPSAEKNNPSAVPDLQSQASDAKEEARRNFRLALGSVDDKTDKDQLNEVRYFLCWLYWDNEQYFEAAALGEFLARRYPDHPSAEAAAKLALASYDRLYRAVGQPTDVQPPDTEFEARHMAKIAEFITRRWPGSSAAESATRILVSYAIRNDRIDDAKALLAQVAPSARPALELQLGNAMWGRYLELSQAEAATRPDDAKLHALRADALALLQDGFAEARKSGTVTESSATSALYLAQSLLADGKFAEAIELLEDPKSGPLSLVISGNMARQRPEFGVEVYKAALRADLSIAPPKAKKAVDVLTRLEQAVSQTAGDNQEQISRIHLGLIKLVQQQVQQLRDARQGAEAAKASGAFGAFLDHIAGQQESGAWTSRYAIAQTYFTFGECLRAESSTGPDKPADGAARDFFTKARDAYRRLLAEASKDASAVPSPAAILIVKKQLGECYRQLGDYKAAIEMYSAVLQEKEAELSVQRLAAYAYQGWGEADDPKWLENAIQGSDKIRGTGKNRIWGWLRLAIVAERASRTNPQYRDMFFEARLEAARCRYLAAAKAEGDVKQQQLDTAKQSIRSMMPLYPDLGGDEWRGKFDDLVKQIQTAAGDKPIGLKEFAATEKPKTEEQVEK
jgi:tetratricopeptide (TPR) repeat protein